MSERKTIYVSWIKRRVNYRLTQGGDTEIDKAQRREAAAMLEVILHEANAYKGFVYVDTDGKPVPVSRIHDGDYDESRRRYS